MTVVDIVGIFSAGGYDWIIKRPSWKVAGTGLDHYDFRDTYR